MIQLAGIVLDSIVDGPGIRVAIFAQGCPHHCKGCQNPETWAFEGGTEMDETQLLEIVRSNPLAKGVTFSGGEPFAQAKGFCHLAKLLKQNGYEVASYSGYTFEELQNGTAEQKELLACLDVLIDGRFEQQSRSLELVFRGSKNQRILDVPASLAANAPIEQTAPRWHGKY